MMRVEINPELFTWARERAGFAPGALEKRFPNLPAWERGEARATLKQLENFAHATYTPIGFLFLQEPPEERLPIPDFRTVGGRGIRRLSPNLLDTVYMCRQRQEWYREFARAEGEGPLGFVGSATPASDVTATAAAMRRALGFTLEQQRRAPTWADALRVLIDCADRLGALVMTSGVVMNNNTRALDPDEFRGFALADDLAPLVFINGADTKAAQLFTLAHELAHIWLGESAVSNAQALARPEQSAERWCNNVAAELLAPLAEVRAEYRPSAEPRAEAARLARVFKVSTLVALRRIHDVGGISAKRPAAEYEAELESLQAARAGGGGDFHRTVAARVSKRFARALVVSTPAGRTLYRDAFRMLGFSKVETLHKLGRTLSAC